MIFFLFPEIISFSQKNVPFPRNIVSFPRGSPRGILQQSQEIFKKTLFEKRKYHFWEAFQNQVSSLCWLAGSQRFPEAPKAPRGSQALQRLPKAPRGSQGLPEALPGSQKLPEAPRGSQRGILQQSQEIVKKTKNKNKSWRFGVWCRPGNRFRLRVRCLRARVRSCVQACKGRWFSRG